ncbi:Tripartite motif-containing 3 [Paramuricea clavata]|uniref:Tripartite motif-containing 3 n=1 Tax=Paramuricea clavata TaxID=317549 RepID=A0A7D9HK50_PARCT|nr:Tripartite motif-containing 3 [Paramuricea clavata]
MSSIVTSILSSTVGLLWNKARDSTAAKLKDGDVTDAKVREIVVRELNDIKMKLDGLSRKDLLSSYNFLQEGVDFLNVSLRKSKLDQKTLTNETQDDRGETSTMPSCGQSGILSEAIELSQAMGKLKCSSDDEYESAKKRFEDARKKATDAFSTETLVLKDRIFAAKLRIVSEILECLDRPETAVTGCLSFLKKFHSLPAIQEIFSVYLDGGIKSMLNKSERVENVKSVMLINYVLFQYVSKFSSKYSFELLLSMPTIELPDRSFSPILDWQEVATRKSMGKELTQHPNGLILDREIYPHQCTVNGHGDVITRKYPGKIQVISSKTGECKVVKLPDPKKGKVIEQRVEGLAVDNNNNVYVVVLLQTSTENGKVKNFVLYVLDENYHVKHDSCKLDFINANFPALCGVSIAINKTNIIIMIKGNDPHVYICDNTGKLQHKFEHNSSWLPSLGISEQDKIITSSGNREAMVTFSEEGNLKSTVKLPEGHDIFGVAYHYVIRKIIVLTYVDKNDSYFLLCYTEAGDLETSTFFCKRIDDEFIKIKCHPSGPVAVVMGKSITFI